MMCGQPCTRIGARVSFSRHPERPRLFRGLVTCTFMPAGERVWARTYQKRFPRLTFGTHLPTQWVMQDRTLEKVSAGSFGPTHRYRTVVDCGRKANEFHQRSNRQRDPVPDRAPEGAGYTHSAAVATFDEGLRVTVSDPDGRKITTDKPKGVGGTDTVVSRLVVPCRSRSL